MRRHGMALVTAAVLLLGSTACGADESPAEAAPELATRLERVDAAIADGSLASARRALEALVAETTQARDAGDISDDQADRILQAASDLLARLPEDDADERPSSEPTEILPPSEPTDRDPEEKDEDEEEEKDDGEKGKDKGKEKDKQEGGGDGEDKDDG